MSGAVVNPRSEQGSLGWSRDHRHRHIQAVLIQPKNYRALVYVQRYASNRCREFLAAANQMADGRIVVDTPRLQRLLTAVDDERRFRGL
jgi:DTW domain-containing protein YfiP